MRMNSTTMDCTRTSMKAAVPLKPEASISLDLRRCGVMPRSPTAFPHSNFPKNTLYPFLCIPLNPFPLLINMHDSSLKWPLPPGSLLGHPAQDISLYLLCPPGCLCITNLRTSYSLPCTTGSDMQATSPRYLLNKHLTRPTAPNPPQPPSSHTLHCPHLLSSP